jgi:hypothetical protein
MRKADMFYLADNRLFGSGKMRIYHKKLNLVGFFQWSAVVRRASGIKASILAEGLPIRSHLVD